MADKFKSDVARIKVETKRENLNSSSSNYRRSKMSNNESNTRDTGKSKKTSNNKFNFSGVARRGYNVLDTFRMPFIDDSLSIFNVFKMLVICLISIFVIRSILFYGQDIDTFGFTDILYWFSEINFSVDFTGYNKWVANFPAILGFLKPLFSLVGLVIEILVNFTTFIASLTLAFL